MDTEGDSDSKINFVPCVTWVRRGVAKPEPERVKLTQEELAAIITKTKVIAADHHLSLIITWSKNKTETEKEGKDKRVVSN
jgi:hypothetical protein